jgi:hypothetical protein
MVNSLYIRLQRMLVIEFFKQLKVDACNQLPSSVSEDCGFLVTLRNVYWRRKNSSGFNNDRGHALVKVSQTETLRSAIQSKECP